MPGVIKGFVDRVIDFKQFLLHIKHKHKLLNNILTTSNTIKWIISDKVIYTA